MDSPLVAYPPRRITLQPLVTTAMTTLSSKIINVHKKKMAKIAVDAVMAVANLERNDVNFDMIKVRKNRATRVVIDSDGDFPTSARAR